MSTVIDPMPVQGHLPPDVPSDPIYRLSVAQYHHMIRAGILAAEDQVELLHGWLVAKMTKSPQRCGVTRRVRKLLERLMPAGWEIGTQDPVTTEDSEPEPDLAVIRTDPGDYMDRHPGPADIAMLVEVADSSVRRDRGIKRSVYAFARIGVYWIVNIPERQVEVYTQPTGAGDEARYEQRKDFGVEDEVPVMLAGREVGRIAVRDLLP